MEQQLRNGHKLVFDSRDGRMSVIIYANNNKFWIRTVLHGIERYAHDSSYATWGALLASFDHPYNLDQFHLEPLTKAEQMKWGDQQEEYGWDDIFDDDDMQSHYPPQSH